MSSVARLAVMSLVAGSGLAQGPKALRDEPLGPEGTHVTFRIEATGPLHSNQVERVTLTVGPAFADADSATHEPQQGRAGTPSPVAPDAPGTARPTWNGMSMASAQGIGAEGASQWLSLHATKPGGQEFRVWILSRGYPAASLAEAAATTTRYLLQEENGPVLEFSHRFTGAPVLPSLGAWEYLWPRSLATEDQGALTASHVTWLGHRYVREALVTNAPFAIPDGVLRLPLLPDVLVGVPSNSRTRDDVRRFDGSDYPMVRLNRDDYANMIRAGMNCLRVDAEQAAWLEHEPVFFWGVGGPEVRFPECLYRSTYLGPVLFLDEPAVGTRDHVIRPRLAKDPELRRALTPQAMLEAFQAHFHEVVQGGAPTTLIKQLRARPDLDLGSMEFPQANLYSWETMVATAAWQLTAEPQKGPCAMVFEPPGRFGSRRTLPEMNMAYGCELSPEDPANLADIIVGFLRGAARAASKDWGLSIYGAVDRADAPWLLTQAYDRGARYFFFWDNYQLACVPHGECLALARHLQNHVQSHPNRDLARLRQRAKTAILLPPGYNLGHTHMGRGNLWGLGELNLERTNRHGIRHRQVMSNFFAEIARCRRLDIAFDLLWDLEGLKLDGYPEVVRVREDGQVELTEFGVRTLRQGPRVPPRPPGTPPLLTLKIDSAGGNPPASFVAQARVTEGDSPIFYTTGTDASGVYRNAMVLWELYGPGEEDYRTLAGKILPSDPTAAVTGPAPSKRLGWAETLEVRFSVDRPGTYRLRAATTDLSGRSAVAWEVIEVKGDSR